MGATFVETLDDLYITTWPTIRATVVDNIFDATPFWFWLKQKGRIMEDDTGGDWLGVPLMVGRNQTVSMYQKGGSFDISDEDILDMARYEWKYMGCSLVRYKVDELKNRGKAKIIDKMMVKLDNAKLSLTEKIEQYCFGDGSAESGLAFDGLDILCDENPTAAVTSPQSEVGGIAQASNVWWRNVYRQMDSEGTTASLHMIPTWKYVYRNCKNGADRPDIMVTTDKILDFYDDECFELKQLQNTMLADAGFNNFTWRGLPIVDSPSCKAGSTYFLNTKYISFIMQAGANFTMTEWKTSPTTLDRYAQIFTSGNIVTSQRSRQGVAFDID